MMICYLIDYLKMFLIFDLLLKQSACIFVL